LDRRDYLMADRYDLALLLTASHRWDFVFLSARIT